MTKPLQPRPGPAPGDVFRNHCYNAETIIEVDPGAKHHSPRLAKRLQVRGRPRTIDLWDFEDAVRAEVVLEVFGGHVGTSDHKLRVNQGPWLPIPQIEGTPTSPLCYMRNQMGSAVVPVPLDALKQGPNVFEFGCGPQVFHGASWGLFKIYAFTVRIYYNESKPRPSGRLTSHRDGDAVDDQPVFEAEASGTSGDESKMEFTRSDAVKVEYVGLYTDFDWEGNGVFRQWHYQLVQGQLEHHLGSAARPPYRIVWDTEWVPDQEMPMSIAAFVTDTHGITCMTPAVEVKLQRQQRSVRMYPAHDVPEFFAVRIGKRMSCKINIADDPARATAGRLFLSTWSGNHADAIELNGRKVVDRMGRDDYYSYDSVPVDPSILKKGENIFSIFSNTVHHSAEVSWPGPVLMLSFPK